MFVSKTNRDRPRVALGAAIVTLYTGWDYLRAAGGHHLMDED